MNDTKNPTSEAADGSKKPQCDFTLKPWQIAVLPVCTREGKEIDVEHATDLEFDEFVARTGIPIDDNGVVAWSFDDRCGVVNFALRRGLLTLTEQQCKQFGINSENSTNSELIGGAEGSAEAERSNQLGKQ